MSVLSSISQPGYSIFIWVVNSQSEFDWVEYKDIWEFTNKQQDNSNANMRAYSLSIVYYRAHIPEETTAMVVKFLLSIYSVNVDKRVSGCCLNQLRKLANRLAISFGRNSIYMFVIG